MVRVDGDHAALGAPTPTTPPPRTPSTTPPRCRRCTTRAASSPTAGCPRTSTPRRARTATCPTRESCAARAAGCPAGGLTIDSFVYSKGGYSATRDFPTRLMRPPTINPGETVTFTNYDALRDDVAVRAGLAQHHLVRGAVQPRLGDRLPARPPARSSSTPASSATGPRPAPRSPPARTSTRPRR